MADGTTGWTVTEWRDAQKSSTLDDAKNRILNLIHSWDKSDPAWITIGTQQQILSQWNQMIVHLQNGQELPLFGVPIAVKDNIDVVGFATTAACPAYAYHPGEDATVVRLLKSAGGIIVGKTNMDQFATGLVGTRSPYGTPACVFSPEHISGGSSSGSASVVARGIVPIALGTDTAGSGRVPAHLNNLIGLKPTRGLVSIKGVVPACKSLDCVSIFALTLRDANIVLNVVAEFDRDDSYSRRDLNADCFGLRPVMAVPDAPDWFGDEMNPAVFHTAVERFAQIGVQIIPKDFTKLFKLAECLYEGPWVAERYTVIKNLLNDRPEDINETVRKVVSKARNYTASDYFEYEYLVKDLIRDIRLEFNDCDGFIVPTAPLNPTFVDVEADPIGVNSILGTYTNFVNLGDFSALAIPAGFRRDGLPFGVTLISTAFKDYALLDLASRFLHNSRRLGGTHRLSNGEDTLDATFQDRQPVKTLPMGVVGAHLSGMTLNHQLRDVNAVLASKTKTSSHYKLYALLGTNPAKPGLRRVPNDASGGHIDVEVWNIPVENVGAFLAQVPPPLAIGSIELIDGGWVHGFVCEGIALVDAEDITSYGGWKQYVGRIA